MNINIDNDYKKYLKYKNKYNELKQKNKIIQLFGGNETCNKNQLITPQDLSSALDYVKNRYNCSKSKKTSHKYFVILYGPPASGKTIARKIACDYIKKTYKEQLSLQEILDSFIDTGVDDIVYDIKHVDDTNKTGIPLKKHFVDLLDNAFTKSHSKSDVKNINNPAVQEQLKKNIEIYFNYRREQNIDGISALLAASASYTNHNVFFETASPSFDYIKDLINTLFYSNYKILFIYPYTENSKILIKRSIERGLVEGRIPPADFIEKMVKDCHERYLYHTDTKNTDAIINMKKKDIIFIKYNTNLPTELYNTINKFETLTKDDEKVLNIEIKKKEI